MSQRCRLSALAALAKVRQKTSASTPPIHILLTIPPHLYLCGTYVPIKSPQSRFQTRQLQVGFCTRTTMIIKELFNVLSGHLTSRVHVCKSFLLCRSFGLILAR